MYFSSDTLRTDFSGLVTRFKKTFRGRFEFNIAHFHVDAEYPGRLIASLIPDSRVFIKNDKTGQQAKRQLAERSGENSFAKLPSGGLNFAGLSRAEKREIN